MLQQNLFSFHCFVRITEFVNFSQKCWLCQSIEMKEQDERRVSVGNTKIRDNIKNNPGREKIFSCLQAEFQDKYAACKSWRTDKAEDTSWWKILGADWERFIEWGEGTILTIPPSSTVLNAQPQMVLIHVAMPNNLSPSRDTPLNSLCEVKPKTDQSQSKVNTSTALLVHIFWI